MIINILLKIILTIVFLFPFPMLGKKISFIEQANLPQYHYMENAGKYSENTDLFIGNPKDSKSIIMFGSLQVRDVLTDQNSYNSSHLKKGAVLNLIKAVRYASLLPGNSTFVSKLTDIQAVFYVTGGDGEVVSRGKTFGIQEGSGVLIPPGTEFVFHNKGKEVLEMFIIEEFVTDDSHTGKDILVKSDYDDPISTGRERTDIQYSLFNRKDGLIKIVSIDKVVFEPGSFIQPHVHFPDEEEIWISLDGINAGIGNQRFLLTPGSAYKAPSDGVTPHVNINPSPISKKLLWIIAVSPRNKKTDQLPGDIPKI